MSQFSQLSKLAISITVSITVTVTLSQPSLPQLPPVPQQSNHVHCHIILRLVGVVPFSTNRKGVFSVANTIACGDYREKIQFLSFPPAPNALQTWRRCSQKAWRTLFGRFIWPINTIFTQLHFLNRRTSVCLCISASAQGYGGWENVVPKERPVWRRCKAMWILSIQRTLELFFKIFSSETCFRWLKFALHLDPVHYSTKLRLWARAALCSSELRW